MPEAADPTPIAPAGDADARPVVRVRPAGLEDRDVLLAWRNDPTAYQWYRDATPVDGAAHDAWLGRLLARGEDTLWVAELEGIPVGSVRLDLHEDGAADVSIVVDAGHRGHGTGRLLLAWVEEQSPRLGVSVLVALVQQDNAPSRTLFEGAGYTLQPGGTSGFVTYLRRVP
jgi:RimJ/RimL family protein N-acetyltransferase